MLYVEDNPASLSLMERIFERAPCFELLSASTAEPGIEIATERQPDIVLMDIHLPRMDGFEALDYLRSHKDTNHMPVIAITASAMPDEIARGKRAGFYDYITKPLNFEKLVVTLRGALGVRAATVSRQ